MTEYSIGITIRYTTNAPNEEIAEERAQEWASKIQQATCALKGWRYDIDDYEVEVEEA